MIVSYLEATIQEQSHPAWDEWIEIKNDLTAIGIAHKSHPAWDEWIEIQYRHPFFNFVSSLIPLGMSGLKWII